MKVLIGGATGYIGRALCATLAAEGHELRAVARGAAAVPGIEASFAWDELDQAVVGVDAVVNLAGSNIGAPLWTAQRKAAIRSSRVDTTRALAQAIAGATVKPDVFVSASGIDYYGDSGEIEVDEDSPPGSSFLASLCVQWETEAAAAPARQVAVRTAFVIGRDAPALKLMALPVRLYVGGALGNGAQFFPWIHIDDLVGVYRLALADAALAGPINAVAPQQVRQRLLAQELGNVLERPAMLPTPAFVLRLALGEQADLLLHGQRAVSRRLGGFEFRYPTLRAALSEALGARGGARR